MIVSIIVIVIYFNYVNYFDFFGRHFLFSLDKAVCLFLVKYFEMPLWHPIEDKTL